MTIFTIPGLILWLFIIPFCIGLIPMPWIPEKNRNVGVTVTAGYLIMLPLCWLVTVPCILLVEYDSFLVMVRWFTVLLAAGAAAGIGICIWAARKGKRVLRLQPPDIMEMTWGERLGWLVFLGLVAWQLYKAFTLTSFDGDDAYYGAQAVAAQQLDTLYRVNPYTGRSTPLDIRHGLALFPIWEAYLGRMSGVHATIVSHTAVPLLLIPLTYVLYYQIGKILLRKRKDLLPMFMVVMALWQMFGNISIYTPETFFLTRTWQGKSFAGSFVIPAVIWLFLCLFASFDESDNPDDFELLNDTGERKTGFWILLACLNFAGGASSSLAVLLSCLMSAGFAVLFAVRQKRFGILVKTGFTCVTGGIYVLLYLLLTHGIIRL